LLVVLCLASAAWAFSFGLSITVGSRYLEQAGCSARLIGLTTTAYYLGVAVTSLLVPPLMKRMGRGVILGGMLVDGVTIAVFPWVEGPAGWIALRIAAGAGTALSLIPMETLVSTNAPEGKRGRDFGIYAVSVALGIGLGPVVGLPLFALAPNAAFLAGGGVALASVGLIAWGIPAMPPVEDQAVSDADFRWQESGLSFCTAWIQGFLEGGIITFLTGYLLHVGYTENDAAGFFAALFLGVVLAQLPSAWLGDRLGKVRLVMLCHGVVFAGILLLPSWRGPPLAGGLFLVGGCCAALYPLGLALLGDRVPPSAIAQANAWFLACNCAGSLLGPWLLGEAMLLWGWPALFWTSALAMAVLVSVGALCERRPGRVNRSQTSEVLETSEVFMVHGPRSTENVISPRREH
jgi:MFS family permease